MANGIQEIIKTAQSPVIKFAPSGLQGMSWDKIIDMSEKSRSGDIKYKEYLGQCTKVFDIKGNPFTAVLAGAGNYNYISGGKCGLDFLLMGTIDGVSCEPKNASEVKHSYRDFTNISYIDNIWQDFPTELRSAVKQVSFQYAQYSGTPTSNSKPSFVSGTQRVFPISACEMDCQSFVNSYSFGFGSVTDYDRGTALEVFKGKDLRGLYDGMFKGAMALLYKNGDKYLTSDPDYNLRANYNFGGGSGSYFFQIMSRNFGSNYSGSVSWYNHICDICMYGIDGSYVYVSNTETFDIRPGSNFGNETFFHRAADAMIQYFWQENNPDTGPLNWGGALLPVFNL